MKTSMKCPFCGCQTDNYNRCEYCGKSISVKAKHEDAVKAANFDISLNGHQHIKNDPRSSMPRFDHIPQPKEEKAKKEAPVQSKKPIIIFTIAWTISFLIMILLFLFNII